MLRKRIQLRMLGSLLSAAILVLSAGSTADAATTAVGTYVVPACAAHPQHQYPGWYFDATAGDPATPYVWTQNDCGGHGLQWHFEPTTIPAGAKFSWNFMAPKDTSIAHLSVDQTIYPYAPGTTDNIVAERADTSKSLVAAFTGTGKVNDYHYGADYDIPAATSPAVRLHFDLGCNASSTCAGQYGGTSGNAWTIYGAQITLSDPSAPTFTSVSGDGWKAAPADASALPISYSATDKGSGIAEVKFYVDGIEYGDDVSNCKSAAVVPCALTKQGQFALDTTRLAEGTHTLALTSIDAAQNETAQAGQQMTITVRRPPAANGATPVTTTDPSANGGGSPAVGDHVDGSNGGWTGDSNTYTYQWQRCDSTGANCVPIDGATGVNYVPTTADVGSTLVFCVTATNTGGSATSCSAPTPVVIAAHPTQPSTGGSGTGGSSAATPETFGNGSAQPAPAPQTSGAASGSSPGANGAGSAQRVVLTAVTNNRSTTQKVKFGKRVAISGRLVGPNGDPVAHAVLSVQVQTAIPGASMADSASIMTGSDGRFLYWAPAGPSRTIRFGYRASTSDASFTDTTDVHLLVSAGVTIKATPKKVRNRHATVFTGRLLGRPLSKRGVVVDLQVFFRGKWRTFGAPRTNAKGAYKFKYRFMAGAATWRFRASVRRDGLYPYESGLSAKQVKVKVTK